MSLKEKYQDVLSLGESLNIQDGYVEEGDGKLRIGGKAKYAYDKDRLWDAIKQHLNWEQEIDAQIEVTDTSIYGIYTVVKGDTLWAVSDKALGHGKHYMKIFEANTDQLKDPDKIQVGQELKIPNADVA